MASQTGGPLFCLDYERYKGNSRLGKPGDWKLFYKKIREYNQKDDRSRHEIKLPGKRKMAITFERNGWQASIWLAG